MPSIRRDAFLFICMVMSLLVVLLTLTLHSSRPVILIGLGTANHHTITSKQSKNPPLTPATLAAKLNSVIANQQPLNKDKYDVVLSSSSQHPLPTHHITQNSTSTQAETVYNQQVNHIPKRRLSQNIVNKSWSKTVPKQNHSANQSGIGWKQSSGLDVESPVKHKQFQDIPQLSQGAQSSSVHDVHLSLNRKTGNFSKGSVPGYWPAAKVAWDTQNIQDDTAAQFAFKHDVLPLVAFIDSRLRYTHQNSTVMLVQVRDVKKCRYNRIIGCGVDGQRAASYRVKPLFVYRNWIHSNVPNMTHSEAVVMCYDLPSRNGSKPYVLYRPAHVKGVVKVFSERPVLVTKAVKDSKPLSVVVCTTVYGRPPWLSEWLRYQQTIGVDYIHLYAQKSFVEQGSMSNPELQQLLADQRLTVDVRTAYLNSSEVYYYSQPLHYQDCLLRYRGVYEFAMLIDTDDFFVPRVPNQPDIHYYLHEMFQGRTASVKLDWIRYFPSCGLRTPPDQIKDGNLTDHLSTYRSYKQYVKSIHQLQYVTEAAIHEVTYLMPGYKKTNVSNTIAYVAHIRQTDGCHDSEQVMNPANYDSQND